MIKNNKQLVIGLIFIIGSTAVKAQSKRWQQAVDYSMNVSLNVEDHSFKGTQRLVYSNNSPDTLTRVFYHLFFNAFQPGSMMDVMSLNIDDPDRRITDRISKLTETEIGFLKPTSLKQNQSPLNYKVEGTILEVELTTPILPHSSTVLEMNFNGQVPIQIRRSGRDNKEGIDYSMAQWYPKICEYDARGWHPDPYIGREFYGVWGDFEVKISIDATYVVAASGLLQNPNKIGYGYEAPGTKVKRNKKTITYHFIAEKVHDFMWAADTEYVHKTIQVPEGPKMHYFYVEDEKTKTTWPQLIEISPKMVTYMNQRFGDYPYSDFMVIQGGDGGMEYPMSTLIMGRGSLTGLVSVTMHEMFHSWYHGVLGNNENTHPWMDEGFTSYAQAMTRQFLYGTENPLERRYNRYLKVLQDGFEEPLSTHANHFTTNTAYGNAAYSMGALIPYQLAYIMGQRIFDKAFKDYYYQWGFQHPTPVDFEKVMEDNSGLVLDWFLADWLGTTKVLDYAIGNVIEKDGQVNIELVNKNQRVMPVELIITYKNGDKERFYMPLRVMRGSKKFDDNIKTTQLNDWPWTNPTYSIDLNSSLDNISKIELDPDRGTVDIDYSNNIWSSQSPNNE